MNIIQEIEEVINQYKKENKGIDRIVVNSQLLDQSGVVPSEVKDGCNTLLGYPCRVTDSPFHRFTVQSK